ncbi:EVE domain-containing protein, partial [Enterococcus faecium]
MNYWIGVASRDHIARGVAGGFCQLCHGKAQALKRMKKGDWIIYYSPKETMDGNQP